MASFQPFVADVEASVAGFTQVIVIGTINPTSPQQVIINQPAATTLLVTGVNKNPSGAATGIPYIRMSVESSTGAATAVSATDMPFPIPAGLQTVRLFASPNPGGKYVITVTTTISSTVADGVAGGWRLYFTPGEGGDV